MSETVKTVDIENISKINTIENVVSNKNEVKVYTKRFWILVLFSFYSMANAFQWIEYVIVASLLSRYFNVSNLYINFTSIIYMILYIPGIIPATFLLKKKGLRFCICLGAFGCSFGSFIKCFADSKDKFWILMIGQTIVALSQLFIINIPPNLAAVWFPANEISSATSFGVFGNQFGIALGFIIPPMIITENNTEIGLNNLNRIIFVVSFVFYVLILVTFDKKPSLPPSIAQYKSEIYNQREDYFKILKLLFKNVDFILLFISYGINVGVFYAISTLLEQIINIHFNNSSQDAGKIGLLLTIAGTIGSIISGIILDKIHLYKLTTLVLYILSFVGMVLFTGALYLPFIWPLFIASTFMGFFMTGYLPIGFELAAEITYPKPEGTSAGLLNMSSQIFGIVFTLLTYFILENYGDFYANILLCSALLVGSLMTSRIRNSLKRQEALKEKLESNTNQ